MAEFTTRHALARNWLERKAEPVLVDGWTRGDIGVFLKSNRERDEVLALAAHPRTPSRPIFEPPNRSPVATNPKSEFLSIGSAL